LVFQFATGEFIGVQHLLRPDIYLSGTRGDSSVTREPPKRWG
jgi:hypothetical protein